ncbi:MAG: hypothetical protein IPJ88_01550 [Myxococcales bacterium]|nr:MAG: hypothetical protein IPJ88_01550 [Myxococcales bacterium]
MELNLLVDGLVKQAMVLIAKVATTGGSRSPLAHLATQVFSELAEELRSKGLGHKVIADMFGISLRAYHAKPRRIRENPPARQANLWNEIVSFLENRPSAGRAEIIKQYPRTDPDLIVGLLNDMVESGWAFRSGDGRNARYRLVRADDIDEGGTEAIAAMLRVLIHNRTQLSFDEAQQELPSLCSEKIRDALNHLEEEAQIVRKVIAGKEIYESPLLLLPVGQASGWAAAMVDHFQAVSNTISASAQRRKGHELAPHCFGSTYHFDLQKDHPLYEEVYEHLCRFREATSELRAQVAQTAKENESTGKGTP